MILLALTTAVAWAAPASWTPFARGEGTGWVAHFDPATGRATRAWGPGIDVGPAASSANVIASLDAFLARNRTLTGVRVEDLRVRSASYVARTGTWYVDYDQFASGVPVWGGGVTFRIRGGKIVMFGVATYPDARIGHTASRAEVIVPERTGATMRYRTARITLTETANPPARRTRLIATDDGAVLHETDAVRWLDGVLSATHDVRVIDGGSTTSVLPDIAISAESGAIATTGADGSFSLADDDIWTARLEGSFFRVTNDAGAEGALAIDGSAPTFTTAAATQAEIDSYVYLTQVREWGLRFAPDLEMLDEQMRSKVNVSVTCAAYWDGAVNFGSAGEGCNNPGQIADVNYHEWGHAFHEASVRSGIVDVVLGEGVGDAVAALQTLSPEIAPTFYEDGRPLRDISALRIYPEDLGNGLYLDSLIFSGAVWDLLGALQLAYGEDPTEKGAAWAIVSQLLADAIVGGPTMTTAYDEFALADDDDGDLSNGTPHLCAIVDAFGAHGLGPQMDPFPAMLDHVPLENQAADVPISVSAAVRSLAPGCLSIDASAVSLIWSVDGVTWETLPLRLAEGSATGTLPAFSAGNVVQYAIVAIAADGAEARLPATGSYSFYVGDLWPLWCENFGESDGGFTHEALSGNGKSADDWNFGTPTGKHGDPIGAYTGASIWGNDVTLDGTYPYGAVNRLHAPPVGVGAAGPLILQYRRWLTVDDGGGDFASVYANDLPVWASATEPSDDQAWVLHTLRIDPTTSPLRLDWELSSDAADSAGGWNIDDVCVSATVDPNADSGTPDTAGEDPSDSTKRAGGSGPDAQCGCGGSGGGAFVLFVALYPRRRRLQ